jgi:phenylacetate-CoA ligase
VSQYYDDRETRTPEQREGELFNALPKYIAHAQSMSVAWGKMLAGVNPADITSRKALAQLPVLRKPELKAMQEALLPFGGLNTESPGAVPRLFMSPGPIFEPEANGDDPWRSARALYAAGIRKGHILQNCFAYHMTPGAWMVDAGARKLGCSIIAAGIGQTEQQIDVVRVLKPDAYVGTPSFLRIIIEKAQELKLDISQLKRALCAAEALPPSLRAWFKDNGVATVLQWYGTAELGMVAYESEALEGMILDEDCILEIVRPGTGDPVTDGEVGEIVITNFNLTYPMIRFGTGDLSAVLPGVSPCGRTNVRIKGWMGRADQTTKVRGMFVHPGQIAEIIKRHPQISKARLVVTGEMANDAMTLYCESAEGMAGGAVAQALSEKVTSTIRDVTKLRGEVSWITPGSLANDGKVIEDARKYD